MKTKIFIMLMVCMSTIPLVASNKIIGTIQDATDKSALIGVNICLQNFEHGLAHKPDRAS